MWTPGPPSLGPPWYPLSAPLGWTLPPQHVKHEAAHHPAATDKAAVSLPQAHVVNPWLAHISHPAGYARARGTLLIEQHSCRAIRPGRNLCFGVFNETPSRRVDGDHHETVRVVVRISNHAAEDNLEDRAIVENAVQLHLVRLQQQRHTLHDESARLLRRGWTTRLTPRLAFMLLLRRNDAHGAAETNLLGPRQSTGTQQHVSVAEAAPGQQLSAVVHKPPASFSLCAILDATLQVALKLSLLQRLVGFMHGDLMGNNIMCDAPPTADVGLRLIGDCMFIDMEASTLRTTNQVASAAAVAADASTDGSASGILMDGTGDRGHLLLGRTMDASKAYFVQAAAAEMPGPVRAFDMHMYAYWLRREALQARRNGSHVIEWLARFHERSCNISRGEFDRLPQQVTGAAKYAFMGSGLHSCFWPERVAADILSSDELAACDAPESRTGGRGSRVGV